jgi:hypothetical protein
MQLLRAMLRNRLRRDTPKICAVAAISGATSAGSGCLIVGDFDKHGEESKSPSYKRKLREKVAVRQELRAKS